MPRSIITRKGQTTIPKVIRDRLGLRAGDHIDFVVSADGAVVLKTALQSVKALKGFLAIKGQRPLSLPSMHQAVRRRAHRTVE